MDILTNFSATGSLPVPGTSSSESRAAASGRIIGTEDRPVTRKSLESRARPVIR